MYVCLCMGVSDREIRRAIGEGACSASEVMVCTGAGTRCGSCRTTIIALLKEGAEGPEDAVRNSGKCSMEELISAA